jgi:hypothetical protein
MKILIAEDDAVDLQLLQFTLERMGHNYVLPAEAGIDDFLPKPAGSDRDLDATARRPPHSFVHVRSSPAHAIDPDLCLLSVCAMEPGCVGFPSATIKGLQRRLTVSRGCKRRRFRSWKG